MQPVYQFKQRGEAAKGKGKTAKRIFIISGHFHRVSGQPVHGRNGMRDSFIIAAEGKGIHQSAFMLFSLENSEELHQLFGKTQQAFGLHTGSHDDGAVNFRSVRTQVITQYEGTHAMPHNQIWDSRVFLPDPFFRLCTSSTAAVAGS